MQNPFLYPGQGLPLRTVAASTGNQTAEDTAIEDGGFSEAVAAHDCLEIIFSGSINGAAGGDITVERSGTIDFAQFHTHATIAMSTNRSFSWNAGAPMGGFFRLKNSTTKRLTAYCQKRIN